MDHVLDADLCVVGAGAAGLTIALQFAGSAARVALLEGGGVTRDGTAGGIYKVVCAPTPRLEIDSSLTWRFGGNTNHWFGNCRPLDQADFEAREWIPDSGWPISRDTLLPFYQQAQRVCGLAEFCAYEIDTCRPQLPYLAAVDAATLTPKLVQTAPVRSFAQLHGPRIREAENVRVCLGVRALHLETNAAGDTVRAVVGSDAAGRRLRVAAGVFVLAAGGIENPRLLLCSTGVHRNGLGNAHDLVGRFFMEHPFVDVPLGESSRACDLLFSTQPRRIGETAVWAQLALSDPLMRRARLTGLSLWPAPSAAPPSAHPGAGPDIGQPDPPRPRLTRVAGLWRDPGAIMARAWRRLRRYGPTTADERLLRVAFEQAPDPRNRVRLSSRRDEFGFPAAELVYRLTDADMQRHARSLAIAAPALGLDGEQVADRMQRRWRDGQVYFFWHHMGTTRMHRDPRHGVVDGDCRVHGVSNLFIAGSSVFPTSGTAAPTLTIVALALRLAEHLRARLSSNPSRA